VGPQQIGWFAGGELRFHEVRWIYDDTNVSIIDLISEKGLVKRNLEVKNLLITDMLHPDGVGYIDLRDETVVTSMQIH
jgi:hypothetical protein